LVTMKSQLETLKNPNEYLGPEHGTNGDSSHKVGGKQQLEKPTNPTQKLQEDFFFEDIKECFSHSETTKVVSKRAALLQQFPPMLDLMEFDDDLSESTIPCTSEDHLFQAATYCDETDGKLTQFEPYWKSEQSLKVGRADVDFSANASPIFDWQSDHDSSSNTDLTEILQSGNLLDHLFDMIEDIKPELTSSPLVEIRVQASGVPLKYEDTMLIKEMERRRKNNEASKRSRAGKRSRFQEIETNINELKTENLQLQTYVDELEQIITQAKHILIPDQYH